MAKTPKKTAQTTPTRRGAGLVVQQRVGIDAAADGSAVEDLLHHGVSTSGKRSKWNRGMGVLCDFSIGMRLGWWKSNSFILFLYVIIYMFFP